MRQISWAELGLRSSQAFHVSRDHINRRRPLPLHDHLDFAEVCWITQGRARHLFGCGESIPLTNGHLILARPGNAHGLVARGTDRVQFTKLVFRVEIHDFLRDRYGTQFPSWPWADAGDPPSVYRFDPAHLDWFNQRADRLTASPTHAAHLDLFLLETLCRLEEESRGIANPGSPPWFSSAYREMHAPENLPGGVSRLQELSGRSYGHLCRTARRLLGQTPVSFVNRLRVQHAARLLSMSYLPVRAIAHACGLRNMTHFYALFTEEYGCSPHRYRERCRFHQALSGKPR